MAWAKAKQVNTLGMATAWATATGGKGGLLAGKSGAAGALAKADGLTGSAAHAHAISGPLKIWANVRKGAPIRTVSLAQAVIGKVDPDPLDDVRSSHRVGLAPDVNNLAYGTNMPTQTQLTGHQAGDFSMTDDISNIFAQGAFGGTDASAGGDITFDFMFDQDSGLNLGLLGVDPSLTFGTGLGLLGTLNIDLSLDGILITSLLFNNQADVLGEFGFSNSIFDFGILSAGVHSLNFDYQFGGTFSPGSTFFAEFDIGKTVPIGSTLWLILLGIIIMRYQLYYEQQTMKAVKKHCLS